jgi:putative DNA primase/helicase
MANQALDVKSPFHAEAIKYAHKGFQVFPVVRNRDIVLVKWRDVATTDPSQINTWWAGDSEKNIGILTGARSGIVVVHFKTSEALRLAQEKGLPPTPVAKANKGHHAYFRYKDELEDVLVDDRYPDIDLIGNGWYVIAPPSVLSKNPGSVFDKPTVFSWVGGQGLDDVELGDVPEWLLSRYPNNDVGLVTTEGVEAVDVDDHPKDVVEVVAPPIELVSTELELLVPIETGSEQPSENTPSQFEDWKSPILFEGAGVEHIKAECLPSWLGDYAGAISRSKQTPEGLAVMLGLSIVAACVQKKFVIAPHIDDDYTEQLSIWTVTALKSAERKSPILNAMRAPLAAWEKEQAESLKSKIQETATAISVAQKRIEKLQQDAAKEPDSVARQSIVDQISEIKRNIPEQVRVPILWTADVTAEALQDMLAENDERMALFSDEGNIFEIMAGLYNDSKVNIDVFLQAYSGAPTKIKRRAREVSLDNPALTFGLAVQPVVIESFANGSKKLFRGKGALGRFLFCVPESMLGKRTVTDRSIVPVEVKSKYESGVRRLLSIPKHVDDAGKEVPRMLVLDAAAVVVWQEFAAKVENMIGPGGELDSMDDWGGKLPGTALRIAGLLHLVEYGPDNLTVGTDTLNRAVGLCDLLIGHAKAAYGLIGADEVVSDAKKIFLWMQKNGFKVFTKTECSRAFKSMSNVDGALKALEERNILKELLVPTDGRSAVNFISNPVLRERIS